MGGGWWWGGYTPVPQLTFSIYYTQDPMLRPLRGLQYGCKIKMRITFLILMVKMRNRYRWRALEEGFRSVPVRGFERKYEESCGQITFCVFVDFRTFLRFCYNIYNVLDAKLCANYNKIVRESTKSTKFHRKRKK